MNDVSILVNTCDLYEDAWDPFLFLLKKNWPNFNYPVFLNTENKKYSGNEMKITTISNGKLIWSERVLNSLEKIDSKYILFFLEDFFLLSPVNTELLGISIDVLNKYENVGVISYLPDIDISSIISNENYASYFSPIKKMPCSF